MAFLVKPLVFLCMPRYNQMVHATAQASLDQATGGMCNVHIGPANVLGKHVGSPCQYQSSLLNYTFNQLWKDALNLSRTYKITHFAMLHADVQAEPGWLDILIGEMKRLGADVVSTAIPFKNETGITSIGLGNPNVPLNSAGRSGDSRRLTLHEIYKLPETFCAADTDEPHKILLPNTGCWVADFTKPWVTARDENGRARFHFCSNDEILFDSQDYAHAESRGEDWQAGYLLADLGAKVYATRKVKVIHHGDHGYSNWSPTPEGVPAPWGSWETDLGWQAITNLRKEKAAELAASSA